MNVQCKIVNAILLFESLPSIKVFTQLQNSIIHLVERVHISKEGTGNAYVMETFPVNPPSKLIMRNE
jgi:hypothetical protein